MCGIAGMVSAAPGAVDVDIAAKMGAALAHRGPDDRGVWIDERRRAALAHTRLAILDLSPAGRQPMHSPCGRYTLVYNGEIYNHGELRRDLAARGCTFRGSSDTETLAQGAAVWGLRQTIERCVGMFAAACWDRQEQTLTLLRDRLGVKPLYYCDRGGLLLFGSELKSLAAHPEFSPEVDRDRLDRFLRLGFIDGASTIYRGVFKLPPGHLLQVRTEKDELTAGCPEPYWLLEQVVQSQRGSGPADEQEALAGLHDVLSEAVAARMLSDVPLGAFLSGGVDSTAVVALMQQQSSRPVQTFTVGFDEQAYDESESAAAVARHLGTEHHEIRASERDLLNLVQEIPHWCDEPFADESQLPTMLLARFARRRVTVALSGDGGDELFAGYVRHHQARQLTRALLYSPRWLRKAAGRALTSVSASAWDSLYQRVGMLSPRRAGMRLAGDKIHKLGGVLLADSPGHVYDTVTTQWRGSSPVLGAEESGGRRRECWWRWPRAALSPAEEFMYADTCRYLPDDLLTKLDRATMAVALEGRVPLLDHRVVEYAWSLPMRMKLRGGEGKWLLRQLLHQYVPPRLLNRPKMGFTVPLAQWLRGSLRDWAENLLDEQALAQQGYFDAPAVRRLWERHLAGRGNLQQQLWRVLMFQAWRERWEGGAAGRRQFALKPEASARGGFAA